MMLRGWTEADFEEVRRNIDRIQREEGKHPVCSEPGHICYRQFIGRPRCERICGVGSLSHFGGQ